MNEAQELDANHSLKCITTVMEDANLSTKLLVEETSKTYNRKDASFDLTVCEIAQCC